MSSSRFTHFISFVTLCLFVCGARVPTTLAEVLSGTAPGGTWDFSAASVVPWHSENADIGFAVSPGGNLLVLALGSAEIMALPNVAFEDIVSAPEGSYDSWAWVVAGQSYVVKTREVHYAKIRFIESGSGAFDYAYQTDGSRNLDQRVPVHSTTWGRVKALYE